MSDRSQDSRKAISSVAEDLTSVTNVAAVGDSSFTELVNAMDSRKPASVTAKSKGTPKKISGLRLVRQANMAKEMTILLTPINSKRFALSNGVTKKLRTQLGLYFKNTGIVNKSFLGMMTESSSWAVPESFDTSGQSLEQLTVPVLLLLTKLST